MGQVHKEWSEELAGALVQGLTWDFSQKPMLTPMLHLPYEPQFGSTVSISGSFTVATAACKHLVPTHQPGQWASQHMEMSPRSLWWS